MTSKHLSDIDQIKSLSKAAHVIATINNWCDKAKHSIYIKRNFDTACWVFHQGSHRIYMGEKLFSMTLNDCNKADFIHSVLFHEMSHALWTDRKMNEVEKTLKEKQIPFNLLNLFEDARIESRFTQTNGRKFNWSRHMPVPEISNPLSIFYSIKFFEGDDNSVIAPLEIKERVTEYYQRCIDCVNTKSVIDVCESWIEEFGDEGVPDEIAGESIDDGDLQNASDVAESGSTSDLDEECVVVLGDALDDGSSKDAQGNDIEINGIKVPNNTIAEPVIENTNGVEDHRLLLNEPDYFDKQMSEKMARKIMEALFVIGRYKSTEIPSKRINKRSLASISNIPSYQRFETPKENKKKINLFIDCSGSMKDEPMMHARCIISAFNRLSYHGVVDCTVFLSSSGVSDYPKINLPISDSVVGKIAHPYLAEGLEKCFKANIPEMAAADINFVVTDGYLADEEIRKAYYQTQGIYTIGLYCNSEEYGADLSKWFDRSISCSTLEYLFTELLIVLKT